VGAHRIEVPNVTVTTEEPGLVRRVFRDVVRSLTRKAQNNDGVMIALFLPSEVAAELAQPGGVPVNDLHLTLRVLASSAADVTPRQIEEWAAAVERAAESHPVLVGNISGVGRFNGDQAGGADVVYATLDAPGLNRLYEEVCYIGYDHMAMRPAGDQPEHDFTPHVTLAYGSGELPEVPTIPVRIDRLTFAIGDERRHYLFSGADVAPGSSIAVAKAEWSAAFINDLPDSSFAVIEPGGEKDEDGKTTPRSLRHLPYKDASGKVDLPHLRNALSRLPQTKLSAELKAKAQAKLKAAANAALAKADAERAEAVVAKAAEVLAGDDEREVEATLLDWARDGDDAIVWTVKAEGQAPVMLVDTGDEVLDWHTWVERSFEAMRRSRMRPPVAKADADQARYRVVKADKPQRYTLGVAYPASRIGTRKAKDNTDSHGDYMTPEEVEAAAWAFMQKPDIGMMHKDGTGGAATVVESYIYRGPTWAIEDQKIEPGDWLVGAVWSEEAWPRIESGELTGWSMQGYAFREVPT
jgi:2'-5' RNA ligase